MLIKAIDVVAALAMPGAALAWEEPARGSDLRADLMDSLRPIAEWNLGAPIEFVVNDLRVSGDVAYASVLAQRPGGAPIDLADTPIVQRQDIDPELSDGPTMHALLQRAGRTWVAVRFSTGATDAWYAWDGYCAVWGVVLPESCQSK